MSSIAATAPAARPVTLPGRRGFALVGNAKPKKGFFWRLLWAFIVPPDTWRTRLTLTGIVLSVVAVGMGLAAYNNANNILFMALSLLISSLLFSGLLSWFNLMKVDWRLSLPPRLRADEPAPVRLEVINNKRIVPTYGLIFRLKARLDGATRPLHQAERLDPGAVRELEWLFHPRTRGMERLEVSAVESQFPFGFLRKSVGGGECGDVLVWPSHIVYEFNPPRGRASHQTGEMVRKPGTGTDLLGLRPYVPGDQPRMVHWKASARYNRLVVRRTAEERKDGFYIVLDAPIAGWSDAAQFERLCSFAASLAEDLFTKGMLRGVSLAGETVLPVRRLADLHAFLDGLARLQPAPSASPPAMAGPDVLTFRPGSRQQVHVHLGNHYAGAA